MKAVSPFHGPHRLDLAVAGEDRKEVEGDAHPRIWPRVGADARHRQAVREQQMVAHVDCRLHIVAEAGRMHPLDIAQVRRAPRLVLRDPPAHAVAQLACHDLRIVREDVGGLTRAPAAASIQGERQIPVIQGRDGGDLLRKQGIDQTVVEVEAQRITWPLPWGKMRGHASEKRYALRPRSAIRATLRVM